MNVPVQPFVIPDEAEAVRLDEAAREAAREAGQSIILDAPAGSGKTTVLTQRFLRLLCEVDEPEEVLAITFTRKAAGEMAERIFAALEAADTDAAAGDDSAAAHITRELARRVQVRSAQRGWRLADNPQRLRVQTIDALNRWLAGRLPLAARGAAQLAVLEDPAAALAEAARNTLLDAQQDAQAQADVDLLLERMENDFGRCERLLAVMLKARTHWLPHTVHARDDGGRYLQQRVQDSLRAIVEAGLREARRQLPQALWAQGLRIGTQVAANRRAENHAPGAWCAFETGPADDPQRQLALWRALADLALTQDGGFRRKPDKRNGVPAGDKVFKQAVQDWLADLAAVPGCEALLRSMQRLPAPVLAPEEGAALAALARLLTRAAAQLSVVFRELGGVDHAFIAAMAREALGEEGEPTDLALALDTRIRHILVDEFQDTSLEQTQLLARLTEGWQEGDGRTLFLVGDPMQSIYQFRGAEVGLFLRARRHGIGQVRLRPLSLYRNFRSSPALVRWFNEVFGPCFPPRDDPRSSAVRHVPSFAGRAADTAEAVGLHLTPPGDVAAEARDIAALVRGIRQRRPEGGIAILVGARSHAGPIVQALAAQGIPVAGVDLVPLGDLPVVRDLAALAHALDHLGDRTAWLALLRAPWCGLSLAELSALAAAPGATLWQAIEAVAAGHAPGPARAADQAADTGAAGQPAIAPATAARLVRVRDALAPLLAAADPWPLARRVESAWLRLGGPAACGQQEDLLHARTFLDRLAGWSAQPDWRGATDLESRLAGLYAQHPERPGENPVQIMTVHRAKGLQFDAVILPGLARRLAADREPLLRWVDLPDDAYGSDLLMAPVRPLAATEPSPLGAYIRTLQAERLRHERVRLLYVAATRAKQELHLFAALDPAKTDPAPPAGVSLASLWPALGSQWRTLLAQAAPAVPTADPVPAPRPPLRRLAADWVPPPLDAGPAVEGLPLAPWEPPGQALQTEGAQDPARLRERALRDVLRRLVRRGRLPTAAAQALPAVRERLVQLGCAAEHVEAETAAAGEQLRRCLADDRLRWLGGPDRSQVETPLALSGLYDGRLAGIRADLAFVADGVRWLVDFALAAEGAAPTVDGQLEAHRARLLRYRELAAQLDDTPARAAVYVPSLVIFAPL